MTIKELKEKRARLVAEAREYHKKNEAEWNNDHEAKFGEIMDDADGCTKQIGNLERLESHQRDLDKIDEEKRELPRGEEPKREVRSATGELLTREQHQKREDEFRRYLRGELSGREVRALEAGADTAGGFLVPSQQMAMDLLKNVDDLVFVRQRAQVDQVTSAESLGIPTLTDPDDFDWTSELATGSDDSTMGFGKRELRPHPLAKRIKVSRKLLRSSSRDVVSLIGERFGYKQAITQEKAFLTGSGANQPLGVFTASSDGISTGRDVSTDMTTTAMTADGLMNVKYTLKGQYWGGARWLFHRDGVKQIAKLKDGEGQYLFSAPENALMGIPVDVSENAPSTFTTGQYVGILANWQRGYRIVDALGMTIQRLDELYAATNQVGFIMRSETDGAPVLEEAFVRVKLA